MRIIHLREEGEISNIDITSPDNNAMDNSAIDSTPDIGNNQGNSLDNPFPSIDNGQSIPDDSEYQDRRTPPPEYRIPPPNRSNYRIVPYYIPVGTRNYYVSNVSGYNYDRIIVRDVIDRNFRFTDGSYGIFAEYEGIVIKAGSRIGSRKNKIEIDIDGEIFTKRVKNPGRARKIVAKLINILYNEGESRLIKAIMRYRFF